MCGIGKKPEGGQDEGREPGDGSGNVLQNDCQVEVVYDLPSPGLASAIPYQVNGAGLETRLTLP